MSMCNSVSMQAGWQGVVSSSLTNIQVQILSLASLSAKNVWHHPQTLSVMYPLWLFSWLMIHYHCYLLSEWRLYHQ